MAYVFGPVPSRRLGRSLGVDLVPFKTCPYDCIYCQLGATTHKTDQIQTLAPPDVIIEELRDKIAAQPDYITLGGSGEPSLYQELGPLIHAIKSFTTVPVAVLTNGSLLWRQELRSSLLQANLVVPSLDAGSEAVFQAVNRPVDGLSFETMLEGLIAFRDEFRGAYWLEIFLLAGYNDHEEEVRKMAACARRIRPDRIQLNTVSRPPTESFAEPVPPDRMAYFTGLFQPEAEVIAEYPDSAPSEGPAGREEVLDLVRRHPATAADAAAGLGISLNDAEMLLEDLLDANAVTASKIGDRTYYTATR